MTYDNEDGAAPSRSLRARIAGLDETLQQHHKQSSRMAGALANRLRAGLTSPKVLGLAVGFGFALEQTSQNRSRSLLYLLNAASDASLLLRALRPRAAGTTDHPDSPS